MVKKILVDLHAEIDMPRAFYYGYLERVAEMLEEDARELTAFIRDHRSRDSYQINIVREYETRCGFCGLKEERGNDGAPACCIKADDEFQRSRVKCVS